MNKTGIEFTLNISHELKIRLRVAGVTMTLFRHWSLGPINSWI